MKQGTLLLVDVSNILYRSSAVHHKLMGPNGDFTGGIFGLLDMVSRAIQKTGACHAVLCLDRPPYVRSHTYADYKVQRKVTKDPTLVERVEATKLLLPGLAKVLGIPMWGIHGFEADDLIALATLVEHNRYQRVVGMTNDSDVGALYRFHNFHVYGSEVVQGLPYKLLADLMGVKSMLRQDAHLVPLMLAISGTHNGVEGLRGMGPAKSWAAVNSPNTTLKELMDCHRNLIERNLSLITLPHPHLLAKRQNHPVPGRTGRFSTRSLYMWGVPYGINVQPWMAEAFEQLQQ